MNKVMRTYMLDERTVQTLEQLKQATGKTYATIIAIAVERYKGELKDD